MLRTIVRKAAERQLLVLLACHRLRRSYKDEEHPSNWPASWDGLWYEKGEDNGHKLTEAKVSEGWRSAASYFCGEWNVFAADLMNEPHNGFWGGVQGTEFYDSDWSIGAATLGNAVLSSCARLLIFVEGTAEFNTEWGQSFKGVQLNGLMASGPVALSNMSKLVMSPHSYGPSLYGKDPSLWEWFPERFTTSEFPRNLPTYWDEHFGFLTETPSESGRRLPMVVGETGGDMVCCDIQSEDLTFQRPGADAEYQAALLRYLGRKDAGFFYFCLNPGSHDTGGVVLDDWRTPVLEKLAIIAATRAWRLILTSAPPMPPLPPPVPPVQPLRPSPPPPPSPPVVCDEPNLCPSEFNLCPPNGAHPNAFCDLDWDCVGDNDFCRAGTQACPGQKDCCTQTPVCPCPAEYFYCLTPNERHDGPFCDLDDDCFGDNDFCRAGTDACPTQRGCCTVAPIVAF